MKAFEISKDGFIAWLNRNNLRKRSIENYMEYFEKYWAIYKTIDQNSVDTFLNRWHNNIALYSIKNMIKFTLRHSEDYGLSSDDLVALNRIDLPRQKSFNKGHRVTRILSKTEIMMVEKGFKKERERLMFLVTYFGALRISELLQIKPYDVDWNAFKENPDGIGRVKIHGKGGYEDYVYLPSNLIKRLARYIRDEIAKKDPKGKDKPIFRLHKRTWAKYLQTASKKALGFEIYPHLLRHCLKDNAEILTLEGWKNYNELKLNELVPTLNIETNLIELNPILNIYKYEINEPLFKIKNRYLDYSCTAEHKGVFKIAKEKQRTIKSREQRWTEWEEWKLISMQKLLETKNKRLIKHRISGKTCEVYSIGMAKAGIIGLALTDSSISKRDKCLRICQSLKANKSKCDIIRKLINDSKLKYSEKVYNQCVEWRIPKESISWIFKWLDELRIPKYKLLSLKHKELKQIFDFMMLGDGTKRKDGYLCNELTTQNKQRIDFFRALCSILGKRTILSYKKNGDKGFSKDKDKLYFRTYITERDNCELYPKQIGKELYKGVVWCPEVKNGTWIAKSNETIFITGNCRASILLEAGLDLREVQILLRHKSIASTVVYTHVSKRKLMDKINAMDKVDKIV